MKEIIINGNEAGQRFDKYLKKYLSEAPGSFIYKMLRKKNIVLNGLPSVILVVFISSHRFLLNILKPAEVVCLLPVSFITYYCFLLSLQSCGFLLCGFPCRYRQ